MYEQIFAVFVSIPSEREGTCGLKIAAAITDWILGFRFPPNGKARVNTIIFNLGYVKEKEFRFPPNGKARVNSRHPESSDT